MTEPAPKASGGGNVFTRKIGPLPMWGWLGIAAGGIVAVELWKSKTSGGGSTTPASDVPQFVNQVYTSGGPPSAPPVTTTGTGGTVPKGKKPPLAGGGQELVRQVATGGQSLAQIARSLGTNASTVIAWTKGSQIDAANLKTFLAAAAHPARKLPKGTVYYVMSPKDHPGGSGARIS